MARRQPGDRCINFPVCGNEVAVAKSGKAYGYCRKCLKDNQARYRQIREWDKTRERTQGGTSCN